MCRGLRAGLLGYTVVSQFLQVAHLTLYQVAADGLTALDLTLLFGPQLHQEPGPVRRSWGRPQATGEPEKGVNINLPGKGSGVGRQALGSECQQLAGTLTRPLAAGPHLATGALTDTHTFLKRFL